MGDGFLGQATSRVAAFDSVTPACDLWAIRHRASEGNEPCPHALKNGFGLTFM